MKNLSKRVYVWVTGLCLCVAALTGCGSSVEQDSADQPDTVGYSKTLQQDVTILDVRENYTDVATFCEGPNRVYLSYNDSAGIEVVANDPRCVTQ